MDYRSLHEKTVADLRRIAKERGVRVPAGTNKALLVQLILEAPPVNVARPAGRSTAGEPAARPEDAQLPRRRGRPPKIRTEGSEPAEPREVAPGTGSPGEPHPPAAEGTAGTASDGAPQPRAASGDAAPPQGEPVAPAAGPAQDAQRSAAGGEPSARSAMTDPSPAPRAAVGEEGSPVGPKDPVPAGAAVPQDTAQAYGPRQGYAPQRMGGRGNFAQGTGYRGVNRSATPSRPYADAGQNRPPRDAGDNPGYRRPMQGEERQGGYRRYPQNPQEQGAYPRAPQDADDQGNSRRYSPGSYEQGGYRRYPQYSQEQGSDPRQAQYSEEQGGYRRYPPRAQEQGGYRRGPQGTEDGGTYRRTPQDAQEAFGRDAQRAPAGGQTPQGEERVLNPTVTEMIANGEVGEGAGVLEIHNDGYGFLRAENYLPGNHDVYVSAAQIRRFNLRTGDYVVGKTRPQQFGDRSVGLIYVGEVNGMTPEQARNRRRFDALVPVFPNERLRMERSDMQDISLRIIDLLSPIGKGQRGMIVSQPKAGKTTLLKKIANAITANNPDVHLMVLLIDERPEEVTDMQRSISGEVVYSTFDEAPENHTRISEMVLERAQRLVELGQDVVVLLDSITRLARAYNLVIPPTGRSLSGGLDPGALYKPKRFFGAARNIENGGSLTVIATALVDTGSRMDDIIFEEFKGTGNMELHLDRSLSDRRIFPAIDIYRSGTRREELLLSEEELDAAYTVRRMLAKGNAQENTEEIISLMEKTRSNEEFCQKLKGWLNVYEKDGFKR